MKFCSNGRCVVGELAMGVCNDWRCYRKSIWLEFAEAEARTHPLHCY